MEIITLFPNGFASNCYIIHSKSEAYIIDPGVEADRIYEELDKRKLSPLGILLTHGHFDHILSADKLREKMKIPLYVHKLDAPMLNDPDKNAYRRFFGEDFTASPAEYTFSDGDTISIGDEHINVISAKGHSEGSVCFDLGDKLITGDTLFADGFGRYDLYGGNVEKLFSSLKLLNSLSTKGDKQIYPGHGERAMLAAASERAIRCFE